MTEAGACEFTQWDPAIGAFVKLTMDATGRILARADLEPVEKWAALRRLFATRTTVDQRRTMGSALSRSGLLGTGGQTDDGPNGETSTALTKRFLVAAAQPFTIALIKQIGCEARDFLVLVWSVRFIVARPGQPLPQLEEIDANLPWCPAEGAPLMSKLVDADAILAEIDAEGQDIPFRWPG